MLKSLYGINNPFGTIITTITVISGLITIWQAITGKSQLPKIVRFVAVVVLIVSLPITTVGYIVQLTCTYVPELYNKTYEEAEELLNDNNLKIEPPIGVLIGRSNNNQIINWQSIQPGNVVLKDTTISVTFSSSLPAPIQTRVNVPDVTGEKYPDAIAKLNEIGLRYSVTVTGTVNAMLDDLDVTSQSIAEGYEVPEGSTVELVLGIKEDIPLPTSTTETVEVPLVIDMTEQEAVNAIEDLGLTAQVWWPEGVSDSLSNYYIVSQSIPAGSIIPRGTLIQLERSGVKLGSPVAVPDVIGKEQHEATELLTSMGMQFQVWWTEENNGASDVYYIVDQSIPGGSTVPAGTLIRLELSTNKPISNY